MIHYSQSAWSKAPQDNKDLHTCKGHAYINGEMAERSKAPA